MSIGVAVTPGTIAYIARNILCHEELLTPLVTKGQLVSMNFSSLSSTVAGDGEIFYTLIDNDTNSEEQQEIMIVFKMLKDTEFVGQPTIPKPDMPTYRTEVDKIIIKCDKNSFSSRKSEFYDASNNLVYLRGPDLTKEIVWENFVDGSPYAALQRIVCKPNQAQQ